MMYDLLIREIKTNQRMAPSTKALADVAILGLDDVSAWLHDSLTTGAFPDPAEFTGARTGGFIRTKEAWRSCRDPMTTNLAGQEHAPLATSTCPHGDGPMPFLRTLSTEASYPIRRHTAATPKSRVARPFSSGLETCCHRPRSNVHGLTEDQRES